MIEHGEYKVAVEGSMIIVIFKGMFNEHASAKVCTMVEEIIDKMSGKPFTMLYNLTEYQGSTPEAHKLGNEHFLWLENQNCLARATVSTERAMIEIVRNEQSSIVQSKITSQIFTDENNAKNWLLSL